MSNIVARKVHRNAFRRDVLLGCQVVRERDFRLVSSLAFDMSEGGMCVLTAGRVLTGEELLVSFRAPQTGEWFDLQATVARVLHGRRPGDRGRCLGLEFQGFDQAGRWRLSEGIRGLPPSMVGRAVN